MRNIFGWSYPPGCNGTPYDEEQACEVCDRPESLCDCPECPKCGEAGNPRCYDLGHMECAPDSVKALCEKVGVYPIRECLRLIEKCNTHHVWLILHVPHYRTGKDRIYYHDTVSLDFLPDWKRLAGIGLGGIAWDGSDWEWAEEGSLDDLPMLEQAFNDALAEHTAQWEAEEEE